MAQTGFTPIQLYFSSTATNVPLAADLANGELAINITDGKLFYKDNAAAVQVIGWKVVPATAGGTGQTSYAVGDLLYANTTTTLAKLADVATGNALISGGVGVAPSWGKIGLTTHVSGILPVANGGTNASTASITSFNNITGYSASGATGTTTTNLVFSTSPSITTPTLVGPVTVTGTASTTGDLTVGPINTDNTTRTIKLRGSVAGNKDFLYSGRSWDNTGLDYDLGRIRVNNAGASYGIEGVMNIAVGRNNGSNVITLIDILTIKESGLTVTGSLAKSSGSFRIDHPLKPETHDLVHSFIEGPQADLIYRGKINLTNGKASVNIDLASGMTEGTFEVLCREVQCFTSNESGWNHVRGSVTGNTLTIECQDQTASDLISWMVIGERKDKHMFETSWTDDTGKVIVEPLKDKFKVQLQGN
jgi:hypothetical protein